MRSPLGAFIFISFMLLMDAYVFQAVKAVSLSASPKTKAIIVGIYWGITVIAVIGFLLFAFGGPEWLPRKVRTYLFAFIMGLFLAKLVAVTPGFSATFSIWCAASSG